METLKSLDWSQLLATFGAGITVIGFVYTFFRNLKSDIATQVCKMEQRIDTLEERMFWLATGKKLQDAILEERMKKESENQV